MCVALFAMGVQAQEKGQFALGVKGGLAIAKVEFGSEKETMSRAAFGAFAQYSLTNHWRVELEGIQPGIFGDGHVVNVGVGLRF